MFIFVFLLLAALSAAIRFWDDDDVDKSVAEWGKQHDIPRYTKNMDSWFTTIITLLVLRKIKPFYGTPSEIAAMNAYRPKKENRFPWNGLMRNCKHGPRGKFELTKHTFGEDFPNTIAMCGYNQCFAVRGEHKPIVCLLSMCML